MLFVNAPLDDLAELLSGQEARVLPELPQSALELLLILVFQSLLLPLLSVAAALLPVIQPEEETFKMVAAAVLNTVEKQRDSHFHNLWCEQLERDGFLLLENQPRVSDRSAVDDLQDLLVKLLWEKVTLKNKAETGVIVTKHLWTDLKSLW